MAPYSETLPGTRTPPLARQRSFRATRTRVTATLRALLRKALREPLLHFVAAGLALFLIGELHSGRTDLHRIVSTPQRETRLANQYALQFGRQPDSRTLQQLVDADSHDEILLREGLALGLDKDDEIVRRRIIQKMQFLLEDLRPPAEPDEVQLAAFYHAHPDRYTLPSRATFSHIYFSADSGDPAARQRALTALDHLSSGPGRAPELGDPFPDLHDFSSYGHEQIERLFGPGEFTEAVFSAPVGHWVGPLKSAYGQHLLYVQSREAAQVRLLTAVHDQVRADYLLEAQGQANKEAFRQLARKYNIIRSPSEPPP
jgi:peptidyl-prolyl cis-trans isomerase C